MKEMFESPEMVSIPGSSFVMGDLWNEGLPDERPTYTVSLKSFKLAKFAVTNHQYLTFLNDVGKREDDQRHLVVSLKKRHKPFGILPGSDGFTCAPEFENLPVTYVSWFGANMFCEWLSKKSGIAFRLPTEEEWQCAAMGSRRLKFSLGNDFNAEHYVIGRERPESVDVGPPSELGLFNMTGNVFEWCSSEYTFCFDSCKANNVLKGSRTIKGAAFVFSDSSNFRNSARFSCPEVSCLNCIGFRVAAS